MKNPDRTVVKMKAIAQYEYGSPDVLKMDEVDRPVVSDNTVLVKVHGAAVHAGDWHLMRGQPFFIHFIYGGLRKPQTKILGCDVAGEVVAVGKNVTQFQAGDLVFGDVSESGFGAFAEYVCAPETAIALKPNNLSFEEAATVPVSAVTALQGLRDVGQIQPGQKVLINGASGGVGSFAVQIAKAFGAEVTGVCSANKVKMVKSLGADRVCTRAEMKSQLKQHYYNLILDNAAYNSPFDYFPFLKTPGTLVVVGGSMTRLFQAMFLDLVTSKIGDRKIKFLACKPNQQDLIVLKDAIEAGKIRPYVDRVYPLSEVPVAIHHLEQRQVRGKVAISIYG
ncbi:NAD(P)-dependent alcohol dehydrogenase [Calothrix sp. UHCC 0171]|uniref:NAD(P)-dependent alcohol dehydrogenase n=1 Tax=Calothrix sp. UHCC 0171 TaxID=3110245 RepID=UPI002B20D4D0|nr:NAD(P)-dependent alcohol dehydrogenase [Calothrix sp. UHCC 0171]MEA5573453.1 NAD(P)-dependent alcohol dehydrogenase [Calothrix sp. UHCC 0171]